MPESLGKVLEPPIGSQSSFHVQFTARRAWRPKQTVSSMQHAKAREI